MKSEDGLLISSHTMYESETCRPARAALLCPLYCRVSTSQGFSTRVELLEPCG